MIANTEACPSLNDIQEQVWKIKTKPKIRMFLWKTLSNVVEVEECFAKRGMKSEEIYHTYGAES